MAIPIFNSECDIANIKESFQKQRILLACDTLTDLPIKTKEYINNRTIGKLQSSLAFPIEEYDLFHLYTILVSVGWNKNDDIFTAADLWVSRRTPVNKPFNLEHDPKTIIGHITDSYLVDEDLEPIDDIDDISIDNLPANFHILTGAVIYRHLSSLDSELEEKTSQLISEIKDGKWYVSMECLFTDFDYGLIPEDTLLANSSKNTIIVGRNAETAFMTKMLRVYGGDGVFNNKRIGRVLRNITFSGKGLVRKPANPESIIVNTEASVNSNLDKQEDSYNMNIEELTKQLEEVQAQLKTLNEQNEQSLANLNTASAELAAKEQVIATLTAEKESLIKQLEEANAGITAKDLLITEKDASIAELTAKITALEEVTKTSEATIATLSTEKASMQENLERVEVALRCVKDEMAKNNRIASLMAAQMSAEEAKKLADECANLDDNAFSTLVSILGKRLVLANTNTETVEETPEEDKKGEEAAQAGVLDNVTPENDPSLSTSGVNPEEKIAEVKQHLQQFVGNLLNQYSSQKKR